MYKPIQGVPIKIRIKRRLEYRRWFRTPTLTCQWVCLERLFVANIKNSAWFLYPLPPVYPRPSTLQYIVVPCTLKQSRIPSFNHFPLKDFRITNWCFCHSSLQWIISCLVLNHINIISFILFYTNENNARLEFLE